VNSFILSGKADFQFIMFGVEFGQNPAKLGQNQ